MNRSSVPLWVLGFSVLLCAGCSRANEEAAVRETVAAFHKSLEARDCDQYFSFFSERYLSELEAQAPGKVERWRTAIRETFVDPFTSVRISYRILSVDKSSAGYSVVEQTSITGIDAAGKEQRVIDNRGYEIVLARENGAWRIARYAEIVLPDSLKK